MDEVMVAEAESLLSAYIEGMLDGVDTSPGTVARELVVRPLAAVWAYMGEESSKVLDSLSLSGGERSEAVLNNLNIFRRTGSAASGHILLRFSSPAEVRVSEDTWFTHNGDIYTLSQTYLASLDGRFGSTLTLAGGVYCLVLPVAGVSTPSSLPVAGAVFTASHGLSNLVSVSAASNFTGGIPDETLAEMAARAADGVTAKAVSGRAHMEALVKSLPIPALSAKALAAGDPGMGLGMDNAYGTSLGGYVDVRVRTAFLPSTTVLAAVGSLEGQRVVLSVSCPGMQAVEKVSRGSTDIEEFSVDYGDGSLRGGVSSTAVMTFTDPGFTPGSSYTVEVLSQPGVEAMQTALDEAAMGVCVRARLALPMFLWIDMAIRVDSGSLDSDGVKALVARTVNNMPIGTRLLPGSILAKAVVDAYPNLTVVDPVVIDHLRHTDAGAVSGRSLGTLRMDAAAANTTAMICASSYVTLLEV